MVIQPLLIQQAGVQQGTAYALNASGGTALSLANGVATFTGGNTTFPTIAAKYGTTNVKLDFVEPCLIRRKQFKPMTTRNGIPSPLVDQFVIQHPTYPGNR